MNGSVLWCGTFNKRAAVVVCEGDTTSLWHFVDAQWQQHARSSKISAIMDLVQMAGDIPLEQKTPA